MLEVSDVNNLELNSKCSKSVVRNMAMVFFFKKKGMVMQTSSDL